MKKQKKNCITLNKWAFFKSQFDRVFFASSRRDGVQQKGKLFSFFILSFESKYFKCFIYMAVAFFPLKHLKKEFSTFIKLDAYAKSITHNQSWKRRKKEKNKYSVQIHKQKMHTLKEKETILASWKFIQS